MATYYIDYVSGNNTNAGTSAAAPVKDFTKWSSVLTGGNTYKIKRGTELPVSTQITDGTGSTSELIITSYYNSDGTDDEAQAKPILSNYTVRTSFTSRNATIPGTWGFTGRFDGLVSNHVYGRERDYESNKTSGRWTNTSFDTLNDWDYIDTLGQSVIYNGSTVTPPTSVMTHDMTYAKNRPYIFWFTQPSGGVKISNLHFKNAYGGISLDFGSGTSSLPLVDNFWVYNCKFENLYQAIGLRAGCTTSVMDGSVLIGVDNLRIYGNRFTYIGQSGIAHVAGSVSWTSQNSWIKWNIFDHCCQAHSNGAIYLQAHFGSGTPRSYLDISYNSVSYTAYGNLWQLDGYDYYAEWKSTDIVFDYNFSWNSKRAGHSNPWGVGIGIQFKHHIHVNTGSGLTAAQSFQISGAIASPGLRTLTLYSCISKDVACLFFIANGWENVTAVAADRIFGKGTSENGATVGCAINTINSYIGSLTAPVQNSYLTGYNGTGCVNWYSQSASNAPSTPGNTSYLAINTTRVNPVTAGAPGGELFFVPLPGNPTSFTSLLGGTIDIMSQITTPTDVEVNYSLNYGNTFWAQIDPLVVIPPTGGVLLNTTRIRRN